MILVLCLISKFIIKTIGRTLIHVKYNQTERLFLNYKVRNESIKHN